MREKVVLAFSGGLDTSFCVAYLTREKQLDVISVFVNTGGFSDKELRMVEEKALKLGAVQHFSIDISDEYYEKCIKYMIYGNVLKNNTYPLSVSSERVFIAMAIARFAKTKNAKYVAHGSTGAGNDQVRFDLVFNIMIPGIGIITPIRDLKLTREEEISYLSEKGFASEWKKNEYSINKGLWGTSIGGRETLKSDQPLPEKAYPSQLTESVETDMELTFANGVLVGVNDTRYDSGLNAIVALEAIASKYAIGRDMHVGDTIIGIKGRVAFEAAAAMIIIKAHQHLEKHVLTKWQLYWKDQISNWYGMMIHEAQYLDPVVRNFEKFLADTQKTVSGKVLIRLFPYRFQIIGIESPHDLMNSRFAQYGEMNTSFTGEDVKGFTKIMANPIMIYEMINNNTE